MTFNRTTHEAVSTSNTFHTIVIWRFQKVSGHLCLSQPRNSDTVQRVTCGPPHLSCVLLESLRLVHQGFLLQFDRVRVEDLVAGLDLSHLPTAARIGF